MNQFMVTFGQRFRYDEHATFPAAHPDGWVTIEAENVDDARELAFEHLDAEWAFLYTADDFNAALYPLGELDRITAVTA